MTGTNHITVDKEYDTSIAGGIVGWAQGAISNSTVNNLTINGTGHYIGGIAGITFDNTETVSDCHLTGINNLIGSNSNFIGGLVGFAHGAISNSTVNNLTISGGGESVGGIAGTTFDDPQTVTNCHLTGTNHISSSGDNVGGLVGFAHGAFSNSTISNLTLDVNGSSVGGIAGGTFDSSNIVDNCHLTGVNSINITNGSWAGGLVGSVHALISNSSLSNTTINASDEYNSIGGIGGEMVGSDGNYISNSYFSGSISSAGENIGGLTGILDYNQIINNSYAIASVNSGTEHHCLVGKDMGGTTVNYSYYRDTCNLGGLGTALSDINMKDSLNYDSSWNINNPSCNDASATYPWRLKSGNYPCLYNESSCACN